MIKNTQETTDVSQNYAQRFGAMIRERRTELNMRQDDLALATGVGRRFIVELEAGKPSCHLGKSLLVAGALGLRPFDLMAQTTTDDHAILPDMLDLPEDEVERD